MNEPARSRRVLRARRAAALRSNRKPDCQGARLFSRRSCARAEQVLGAVHQAQVVFFEQQFPCSIAEESYGDLVQRPVGGNIHTLGRTERRLNRLPETVVRVARSGVRSRSRLLCRRSCKDDAPRAADARSIVHQRSGFELLRFTQNHQFRCGGRFRSNNQGDVIVRRGPTLAVVKLKAGKLDRRFAGLERLLHVAPRDVREGFLFGQRGRALYQLFLDVVRLLIELRNVLAPLRRIALRRGCQRCELCFFRGELVEQGQRFRIAAGKNLGAECGGTRRDEALFPVRRRTFSLRDRDRDRGTSKKN